MSKQKEVRLQKHNYRYVGDTVSFYGGKPLLAADKESKRLSKVGYASNEAEREVLKGQLIKAFVAYHEGEVKVIEDYERPDEICMGCFKSTCGLQGYVQAVRDGWVRL